MSYYIVDRYNFCDMLYCLLLPGPGHLWERKSNYNYKQCRKITQKVEILPGQRKGNSVLGMKNIVFLFYDSTMNSL